MGPRGHREKFLWTAANVLLARAPTVIGHLGGALVKQAGRLDAMSAHLQKLHCGACGGLMVDSQVRVRTLSKKRRRPRRTPPPSTRSVLLRTCAACQAVNASPGAARGDRVQVENREAMKVVKPEELSGEKRKRDEVETQAQGASSVKQRRKEKKKRDAVMRSRQSKPPGDDPSKGFAGSFLFQPL